MAKHMASIGAGPSKDSGKYFLIYNLKYVNAHLNVLCFVILIRCTFVIIPLF
jgi:hypothetical protein